MPQYTDALRGYAFSIMRRDRFKCRYCGFDGRESFANWLCLSWDHLLPNDHPQRDDPRFIVTSCRFCNEADNQYFRLAKKRGLKFNGLSPEALVAQRKRYVDVTRQAYHSFWVENVTQSGQGSTRESHA
ncbi:MAG: hypothetical protein IH828_00755 [Nitrospinae bacterium]|nr:hypothetical protein [Nitrospinota bacterium]